VRKALVLIGISIGVAACNTGKTESVIGPTGTQVHTTKCSQSSTQCFAVANATCRGPYSVVDSYSKAGGLLADIAPGPVTWYYMTYQCGPSNGVFPQFPQRGRDYTPPSITQCNRSGNSASCITY